MTLPLIPQDKANHFIYGFVIYFLANLFLSPLLSFTVVLVIAVLKEFYDSKKGGTVEVLDAVATLIPALLLFLKTLIFK